MGAFIRRALQVMVLAGAAVQLAGLAQSLHPVFDSIAHFRLHITVLLGLGILLLLLLRSWRTATAALAVGVAGLAAMAPALGSIGMVEQDNGKQLVIVQFNMLFRSRTPRLIAEQVRAAKADAVMLQEVSRANRVILDELAADYPYQTFCQFSSVGGVAVLSRWPNLSQGCREGQGLAWLRVDAGGTQVTFAALHLHWPYPYQQAQQIDAIRPALLTLPGPVVLAGDFNAAPWSHAVARVAGATGTHVAGGLRLSLKMKPLGLGPWPMLPIDHILVPATARVADIHLGNNAGSDHLPVIATIELAP